MSTVRMTGDVTLSAFPCIFSAKREHIATVTTPIRTNISQRLETMWDTVPNLLCVVLLQREGELSTTNINSPTPVVDLDMHFVTTFS